MLLLLLLMMMMMMMMMNRFGTMCLEEQAQEEPEVEAEEVAEEIKTRADMKKAKLTQKEIASFSPLPKVRRRSKKMSTRPWSK